MSEAERGLAGERTTVMLTSYGPARARKDLETACNPIERLEDSTQLAIMTRELSSNGLSEDQARQMVT